jgi:hypothetical protein
VVGPGHQADQIALWNLSASLEQKLVQPFQEEYGRLVNEARVRLAKAGRPDDITDARSAA